MEKVEVDIITGIPYEIKLLILQQLDSFSLITLEKVSKEFAELSYDKKLSSNLCFYKDYRFTLIHLESFLLHKLRKEIITSLNINCVYWIPKEQLKRCLSLHTLKSLYALDTKLDLNDVCLGNLPNLNVLAITQYSSSLRVGSSVLPYLKKLCVHYQSTLCSSDIIKCIFKDCIRLEELWFLYKGNARFIFNMTARNSLKRFVTHYYASPGFTICNPKFNVTFKSKYDTLTSYICFENTNMNISNIYEDDFYESLENVLWTTYLNELGCDYPFGLHDAKKLIYKQETLASLYFHELSLNHTSRLCCEKLQSTVVSILTLPNTKLLRKIRINMCIFGAHSETSEINEPLSKRSRTTEDSMTRSKLDLIVEHLPLLEELEILECINAHQLNPDVLRSIGKLSKLKSLDLEYVSNIGNGKYLLDICKSCANLTSLKIYSIQNTDLNNHLCMSIPYLRRLKDLLYQQPYLPLDRILESLASNNSHELERVVLMCDEIETFSSEPLKKFITQNPQLQMLYIAVKKLSKADQEHISKGLKEMTSDQQIFIVTNDVDKYHLLPYIHKLEMAHFSTSVGVINPFNDFH